MSNTNFPGVLDTPTNPATTDTLASVSHILQHGLENDALVALETKLGYGASNQLASSGSFLIGTASGQTQWVTTLTNPSITTSLFDANGLTWVGQTATANAVNYPILANSATASAPSYGVAGTDTNIDNNITSKGSGKVRENGSSLLDFRNLFGNTIGSGGVWAATSGLDASMTAGVLWINGIEYSLAGVTNHAFTASSDIYIDYTASTGVTYTTVANGATSGFTLAANSIRLAKVVTGASTVSSVTQSGVDTLLNLIYPTSPFNLLSTSLSNSLQKFTNSGTAGGTFYYTNFMGFKVLAGITNSIGSSSTGGTGTVIMPTFFNNIIYAGSASGAGTNTVQQLILTVITSNTELSLTSVAINGSSTSVVGNVLVLGT